MVDCTFYTEVGEDGQERSLIPILGCYESYVYTIPSFSVVMVKIRRIKYQCLLPDQSTRVVDGFIRDDLSLDSHVYPIQVSVARSSENACIVEADEMERSIDITLLDFVDKTVFVIWHWDWKVQVSNSSDDETPITVIPETPPMISSDEDSDDDLAQVAEALQISADISVTHTVAFKCIGATKENYYQERLAKASQLISVGKEVPARLKPEPDNPVDAKAIAFQVQLDGMWETIGYILQEIVDEVHEALNSNKITAVSIDFVKYLIRWNTPGWYAGINITRIGEWSLNIIRVRSARIQ